MNKEILGIVAYIVGIGAIPFTLGMIIWEVYQQTL